MKNYKRKYELPDGRPVVGGYASLEDIYVIVASVGYKNQQKVYDEVEIDGSKMYVASTSKDGSLITEPYSEVKRGTYLSSDPFLRNLVGGKVTVITSRKFDVEKDLIISQQ